MRLAGRPLKQIVKLALETIHVCVDKRACVVGGRVVDDQHVDVELIRPFSGEKAIERSFEQRDPIERRQDDVDAHQTTAVR